MSISKASRTSPKQLKLGADATVLTFPLNVVPVGPAMVESTDASVVSRPVTVPEIKEYV